jgi:DNA-binding MarR family transcriptional regulator
MLPAEELRYLILAAQREGNRLLGRELRPLGVTSSQAEVLRILQERQPLTLTGLGELLVCESGSSPSRLVDRLTAAGLVDRRVPQQDRRHIELTLTEEGMRLARLITKIEDDLYRAIDAAADGRDLDEITGFLRAFVDGLPSGQALSRRIATAGSDRA